MLRALVCSVVLLAFGMATLVADDAKKDKKGKKCEVKIVKVDAKKGTVVVKMRDEKSGKMVDRTFTLAEDAEYLDSTGRVATIDVFTSGNWALIVEREGKIVQMKKHNLKARKEEKTPPKGS